MGFSVRAAFYLYGPWLALVVPLAVFAGSLIAAAAEGKYPVATRAMLWGVLVLSAAAVLIVTLRPNYLVPAGTRMPPQLNLVESLRPLLRRHFASHELRVDALGNLLLLTPVGAALALLISPRWSLLLVGLFALSIETAQWALALGRYADIGDWLLNTIGGALGAVLAWAAVQVVRRHHMAF